MIRLQNLIRLVRVNRTAVTPLLEAQGGDLLANVEHFEPQGVHFQAPDGARGALLAPNGSTSVAIAVCLSAARPAEIGGAGEGGLHFLGEWRVYLDSQGRVHLSQKDATDAASLASVVNQNFEDIKTHLDDLKTKYDAHVHLATTTATVGAGATPGVVSVTAPTVAGPTPPTPADVASEKVLIE